MLFRLFLISDNLALNYNYHLPKYAARGKRRDSALFSISGLLCPTAPLKLLSLRCYGGEWRGKHCRSKLELGIALRPTYLGTTCRAVAGDV